MDTSYEKNQPAKKLSTGMIRKGDRIYNPITGETIRFVQTSADTKGELLKIDVSIAPGGGLGIPYPVHSHPKQEETIIIRSGWLRTVVDSEEKYLGPGDQLTIPAGTVHELWNARKSERVDFIIELRPALEWEIICETMLALIQSGKVKYNGEIGSLQMAVIINKYPGNFRVEGAPSFFQNLFLKALAPIGRMAGYKAELDYRKVNQTEHDFQDGEIAGED